LYSAEELPYFFPPTRFASPFQTVTKSKKPAMNPTTRHTPSPQQRESFLMTKIPGATTALRFVVAVGLLAAAEPTYAQCPLSFASASNYAVGSFPRSVAVGDFNADGRPDLAIANFSSNNVSILLGIAPPNAGTFQPAVNYAVGTNPGSVAVADFNADGRPDLAVANRFSNNVSVLLGNANGTFQPAINYAVSGGPVSVAPGDFNADGRPDLAVANQFNNNVSILLRNIDGTFQPAVSYAVGSLPQLVAVGDFNADGRPDLAVANANSGNVSILLGNANGTFQAAVNYAAGISPRSLAVGNFNGDGRPDLAVPDYGSNTVSILMGNANGTFQAAVNYAVGSFPSSVTVGDFNADSRPDLAVANNISSNVSVLRGNANGTFQAAVNYAAGDGPYSVAVGDFNADGKPDLASVNNNSTNVSILLNTNTGFPPPGITQQPASQLVLAGQIAAIAVTADGFGNTLTYQWRKNGIAIANGGTISGADSPTLTFTPARLSDVASYDVLVTGSAACGVGPQLTTSATGILAVTGTNPCPADFNIDGELNPDDLADFIGAFFAGCG